MGGRVFFFCFLVSAVLAGAPMQAQTADSQVPGSVSGHVYCADTDKPARLARITIEPVDDLRAVSVDAAGNILRRRGVATAILTQTGADGAYLLDSLPPGQYYIVAELPGYLSPITEFGSDELRLPSEQDERKFHEALQRVTVLSGQTARMDFRLERGAAIEGKILYEDGSAVAEAPVIVLLKDAKVGWKPLPDVALNRFQSEARTDDRGRYRIAMLPPGEYTAAVEIQLVAMTISGGGPFPGQMVPRDTPRSTRIYLGDTTSRADAKTLTVHRAEEYTGADITVAMHKLHSVSGSVVASRDGHAIDKATVTLVDAVDGNSINETSVHSGRFAMAFVPEGKYLVKVTDAADGVIESTPLEGTQLINTHFIPRHVYADAEQPLQVSGDIAGVTVKVPEPANHRQ